MTAVLTAAEGAAGTGAGSALRLVDAAEVKAWLDRGEAVLLDVREPAEHARERIPGAELSPLSRIDAAALPDGGGKLLVLHCASGARSAEAARRLAARGVEVVQLKGGLAAWKRAGLPVAADAKAPLPIMRQVQIVAGTMALLGTVLGFAVHPALFLISGMVGAGLMLAGFTGNCPMAKLLLLLPYNRAQR